jgi:ankyrin repeat protein
MNGQRCNSVKDLINDLISMVWMLLGQGAEVNIRDAENKTPLHNTLIRSADMRMAEVLCDNGANVNATDRCGNTPLMALCSPMPWRYYDEYGPSVSGFDISQAVFYLLRFDNVQVGYDDIIV